MGDEKLVAYCSRPCRAEGANTSKYGTRDAWRRRKDDRPHLLRIVHKLYWQQLSDCQAVYEAETGWNKRPVKLMLELG